jgi:hypothetical protein
MNDCVRQSSIWMAAKPTDFAPTNWIQQLFLRNEFGILASPVLKLSDVPRHRQNFFIGGQLH